MSVRKKVGILGGGQLAMLLCQSVSSQDLIETYVWGNSEKDSAFNFADHFQFGDVGEETKEFFRSCDCITLESEFYQTSELQALISEQEIVPPLKHYSLLETKLKEREFFARFGLESIPYSQGFEDITSFPIMLKTSFGGYDGYGNFVIKNRQELTNTLEKLRGKEIFWEPFLDIKREVATTITSDGNNIVFFPFVETIQRNSICHEVRLIEDKFEDLQKKIESCIKEIGYRGTLAFEFIETKQGGIFFNESSPRVHNSSHYTSDLCEVGQFENHMRVCANLAPEDPKLKFVGGGMINLLCENWNSQLEIFQKVKTISNVNVVLYGKDPRPGRKMGHINYWSETYESASILRDEILKLLESSI